MSFLHIIYTAKFFAMIVIANTASKFVTFSHAVFFSMQDGIANNHLLPPVSHMVHHHYQMHLIHMASASHMVHYQYRMYLIHMASAASCQSRGAPPLPNVFDSHGFIYCLLSVTWCTTTTKCIWFTWLLLPPVSHIVHHHYQMHLIHMASKQVCQQDTNLPYRMGS